MGLASGSSSTIGRSVALCSANASSMSCKAKSASWRAICPCLLNFSRRISAIVLFSISKLYPKRKRRPIYRRLYSFPRVSQNPCSHNNRVIYQALIWVLYRLRSSLLGVAHRLMPSFSNDVIKVASLDYHNVAVFQVRYFPSVFDTK